MILLLLGACTVFQPLDGTWLFQVNPNSSLRGDCAGDDSGSAEYEVLGTSNMWVDIYTVSGDQIAILWNEPMLGTLTGSAIEASYETGYSYKKRGETKTTSLEATLSGGAMEGTVQVVQVQSNDGDDYSCTTANDFSAVRSVSSPDSFAGN